MSDLVIGQIIRNSRTGGTGKFEGTVRRWNGRHETTKALVFLQGDTKPKIWALSSCEVVEQQAPRALIHLKELFSLCMPHMQNIKNSFNTTYSKNFGEVRHLTEYILEDDCITSHLGSAEHFQAMPIKCFYRVLLFIQLEYLSGRMPKDSFGGVAALTREITCLYFGKNPE